MKKNCQDGSNAASETPQETREPKATGKSRPTPKEQVLLWPQFRFPPTPRALSSGAEDLHSRFSGQVRLPVSPAVLGITPEHENGSSKSGL